MRFANRTCARAVVRGANGRMGRCGDASIQEFAANREGCAAYRPCNRPGGGDGGDVVCALQPASVFQRIAMSLICLPRLSRVRACHASRISTFRACVRGKRQVIAPVPRAGSSAVEHVTFNHVVEGSIPSRLTIVRSCAGLAGVCLSACTRWAHQVRSLARPDRWPALARA